MYQLVPRLILIDPLHRLIEPDPIGKNTVRGRSVTQRHQNRDVTFSRYRSGFKNIEHREVTRYRAIGALSPSPTQRPGKISWALSPNIVPNSMLRESYPVGNPLCVFVTLTRRGRDGRNRFVSIGFYSRRSAQDNPPLRSPERSFPRRGASSRLPEG
jgi:hypothetical protein